METDENMRCPKCNNISVELVPIGDKNEGLRICNRCKNKIKRR